MAIYRGPGGPGDATTDATNEATVATNKAAEAAASATAAAASATSAASSATSASTSATNSSTSATSAASSASAASTSATNASNSATSASTAQTAAETAKTGAETAQTAAETAETNASASATAAATSATSASTSATNASTSATSAATSATNAATSETNAAASYDSFDDRYLGAKSSAPTVDNDGDALLTGALYWNSTLNQLYVWDGAAWDEAAFSVTGAVTSFNTRTGAVTLTSGDVTTALGYTPSTVANLNDISDVTITTPSTNQILKYNGSAWVNGSDTDTGILYTDLSVSTAAAGSPALSYNNTNGVFTYTPPDLTSYITASSTDTLTNKSGNISQWTNDSGYLTSFTETNDLTSAVTWANVPDINITQSSVTQHQAALSITSSQVSDLASSTITFTNKTFDANGTGNSISNIEVADLASGVLDTDLTSVSASDDTLASAKAIKTYVDTIAAAGIHYHTAVRVESPTNLNAAYNNGTSGVGATLTNSGTLAAISIDGIALNLNDRVLIYNQSNAAHNGVYYVSTVGDGATAWVLTRATDADSYGASDPNALGEGDAFFVLEGNTGAGELYVMNTSGTITFGTTNITFSVIAETAVYSAGQSLTLSGTEFSVTAGSISSTQLTSAVQLQILDSSGSVVKSLYGSGS